MRFTKMHGIGNDYIYLDCITNAPPRDPVSLAKAMSDRHFGVGSDGLILICPSERADVRMRMFNADGSEAEMCGNGIRCVAKYVYDHGLVKKSRLSIETGRGELTLELHIANGKVERVTVDMGRPILEAEKIPTTLPGPRVIDHPVSWCDVDETDPRLRRAETTTYEFTCVSMGNPHTVLYADDVARIPLESVGPKLEHAPFFPRRINVHFVQVHSPGEVTMRTWERGSGITLACGTGACAVCVAGVLTGRTERRLLAHLPGGDLELHWSEADDHVYMTGPATEVFSGEWPEKDE
jgi:diaminopimelate epimerase